MAKKFTMDSFTDTFNASSREVIKNSPFVEISLSEIKRNEKNFYSIADIDTLKHSIKTTGLQSPLVVLPKNANGDYVLLSGERRLTALKELVDEGYVEFSNVYCAIIDPDELDIPLSYDEKVNFLIVTTNAEQREMTNEDILQQIKILKDTYASLKANGEDVPVKTRAFVAQSLNMSETQVQRYSSIEKNLLNEFFELFCSDVLPISVACEIAKLDNSTQKSLYEKYKDADSITQPMVDEFIASTKTIPASKEKTPKTKLFNKVKKALTKAEKAVTKKGQTNESTTNQILELLDCIENCAESIAELCE